MKFKLPQLNPSLILLTKYLLPYKWKLASAVFFMLAAGGASSLMALLLGKITDAGSYANGTKIIYLAPLGLIFIAVLHGGSMFMSNYILSKVSQSMLYTLRKEIFHNLLRWPATNYLNSSAGSISSKFVFEANAMLSGATKSVIIFVRDSCQVIALLFILLWTNWQLALISFVIAPATLWLLKYIATRMKTIMASCQSSFGTIMEKVKEVYEGNTLIKMSNSYSKEYENFKEINEALKNLMVRMVRTTSLGTPITQFICMVGVSLVLAMAMYQTHAGQLTLGQFITFLTALLLLVPPLKNLAGVNSGFVMMAVASESIFSTLDQPMEKETGNIVLSDCQGSFIFDHISLRYPNSSQNALTDINFTVKSGEKIALVGSSGSGKSSLINLIPRFWSPTEGKILLDGHNIQELTLDSLRKNISIVSQDVFLFDDSIRNNIAYGKEVSEEELKQAAEASSLTTLIESLPDGLDTQVGEKGKLLSGGQKQRISIARAFIMNRPILILDEATSALDSESEEVIKDSLHTLMGNKTTFIVSHKLSSIRNADKILVLSKGHVVETGTHEELMSKNGEYSKLCKLQELKG